MMEKENNKKVELNPEIIRELFKDPALLEKTFEDSTDEDRTRMQVVLARTLIESKEHYSGPLPHPEILKQYDECNPGFSKTIVSEFQKQGEHRRKMELQILAKDFASDQRGSTYALLITILAMVIGGILIYIGRSIAGMIPLLAGIANIAVPFILKK